MNKKIHLSKQIPQYSREISQGEFASVNIDNDDLYFNIFNEY